MNLPANTEAEQFVLGSVLLDDGLYPQVGAALGVEDFLLDKHKRIAAAMRDLAERGERIEYLTLCEELERRGDHEAVSVAYIASLNEGLPRLDSIDSYVQIVKGKSLLRRMIHTAQAIIGRCSAAAEDVPDILAACEADVLRVADQQLRSGLATPREAIEQIPGGAQAFLDPSHQKKGVGSPFMKLEEMTTGMHGGELIILAARPAMGKTALALTIAQHVANEKPNDKGVIEPGSPVAVFSLEMSRRSLLERLLCAEARVDQHRFRHGWLNDDEKRRMRAGLHALTQAKLYIDDSANATVADISAKCRRLRSEHGLALVVVDYLQLMDAPGGGKAENRVQQISQISRGLKLLAKDLDTPVLALSQLSRKPEERPGSHRPLLGDLRESGAIEQDADRVMFIFREEVYKPDREDLKGRAELIIAKQRNGPTGVVHLAFVNKLAKFENLAADIGGDEAPFDE